MQKHMWVKVQVFHNNATSAQNPLNQVERLHPQCYSDCHIWLGQHRQHISCSSIRIFCLLSKRV